MIKTMKIKKIKSKILKKDNSGKPIIILNGGYDYYQENSKESLLKRWSKRILFPGSGSRTP